MNPGASQHQRRQQHQLHGAAATHPPQQIFNRELKNRIQGVVNDPYKHKEKQEKKEEDEDEEHNNKKIWKSPSQHQIRKKHDRFKNKEQRAKLQREHRRKLIEMILAENINDTIETMTERQVVWTRKSKYGKKSHYNFQEWINILCEAYHDKQAENEDDIFDGL